MTVDQSIVTDWVHLIEAEYLEMPGLDLTKARVQRLWNLEPWLCEALLDTLTSTDFLSKTAPGSYVLSADQEDALIASLAQGCSCQLCRVRM